MNAIVVVGHKASGYADVWATLLRHGIAAAKVSRQEKMSPVEITGALCKAYKRPGVDQVIDESDFNQVRAAPVWQRLALDLMLGNINQPSWGWADPRAVFALDYWAASVPQLRFVLVYDEPHRVLRESDGLGRDSSLITSSDVVAALDNWSAFNRSLLQFYLRHPQRALLVHASEMLRIADQDVQQLRQLLDASFSPSGDSDRSSASFDLNRSTQAEVPGRLNNLAETCEAFPVSPNKWVSAMSFSPAANYLVDAVIAENPFVIDLYAELQSVADLPTDGGQRGRKRDGATVAWGALMRLRDEVMQSFEESARAREEAAHAQIRRCQEESQLVLSELHEVQEDLERQHLLMNELEHRWQQVDSALHDSQLVITEKNRRIEQLKSIRFGKEKRIKELKAQLDAARKELEVRARGPVDLSTVPGRVMIKVAALRLLDRLGLRKV